MEDAVTRSGRDRRNRTLGEAGTDPTRISQRYRLRVTLLEDLHSGTGTGNGVIDAVQALDRFGRPVIRATHVKGVLRAAADELLALGSPGVSAAQVAALFGHRQRAWQRGALQLQSLYLVEDPSQPHTGERLVWTSTARKPESRVPLEDTLHAVEHVSVDTVFEGELLLREPALASLLERCVRRTDRLGARRNRGAGLIQAERIGPLPNAQRHTAQAGPAAGQTRLRLILENLDPLCLAITGNPGNIIPSEGFIRGQTLLGAFAGWALAEGRDARDLIGRRCGVGNAWPLPDDVTADSHTAISTWDVLPIPLHLHFRKPGGQGQPGWPWWASLSPRGGRLEGWSDQLYPEARNEQEERPKRPGNHDFVFRTSPAAEWRRYTPEMNVHLRNQVPAERTQSASPASLEAALFSEEEIAERTLFLADLEFPDIAVAHHFVDTYAPVLLGDTWLAVGRGGRPVQVVAFAWLAAADTADGNPPESASADAGFTLTLESDLIARGPLLGFYQQLSPHILVHLCGVGIEDAIVRAWDWTQVGGRINVHGFNSASGLPRAPAQAIRRGSTIRVSGPGVSHLKHVLETRYQSQLWLGERTWEGFGRFRLDFDPVSPTPDKADTHADSGDVRTGEQEAILAASRAWADRLLKEMDSRQQHEKPSKSQWQYLREQALIATRGEDVTTLLETLHHRSASLGGSGWRLLPVEELAHHLEQYATLADQRLFLDTLVRWLWPKLKDGDR